MKKSDFTYDLPKHLIAQYPLEGRAESRLMVCRKGSNEFDSQCFAQIVQLIEPGDLLVFNNTKVIPARLMSKKSTGGRVEIFIERLLGEGTAKALLKANKSVSLGTQLYLDDDTSLVVTAKSGMFYLIESVDSTLNEIMTAHGHMPLPPYIQRDDEVLDSQRYQTVYAKAEGAVAAPTAGLHFDNQTLQALKAKGVNFAFVTLHVGAGTFQPVKCDDIVDHKMHKEWIEVNSAACDMVNQTVAKGKRVIAVGTTAVRCLETACEGVKQTLKPYQGDTQIFIYPGYEFKVIDGLLTNFHLPESTLLMLVSALMGTNNAKAAYAYAVEQEYRFFSYGDAMLIL